jgi:GR25 family glycosyltransferase involved in LPS biosynthesis
VHTDLNALFNVQIISTDNRIRSKNLKSKLVEMGLKIQISPGIVPNKIDYSSGLLHSPFISRLICQRNMSIGEVGCALAHINALDNFLSGDHKYSFVFEDDAEVIHDFNFEIIMMLLDSNLPIIIALGWIPGFAIAKNPEILIGEELIELSTSPTCTFAYAINRPAAKAMLSRGEKIIDVADWPVYTLNKVNFYSTHSPWVTANHDPKFSTIGVRSAPIARSPVRVFGSRIKLATSLVTLIFLSTINKLNATPKQIVHRLLIRDLLYRYGTSQVNADSTENNVIPLPLKFRKLLDLLKLT